MPSFFHSIRWRLQAWHGLILLIVIGGLCLTVRQLALDSQSRRIDRDLERLERRLFRGMFHSFAQVDEAERPGNPEETLEYLRRHELELPNDTAETFQGDDPGYAYFAVVAPDGEVVASSPNFPGLDLNWFEETKSRESEKNRIVSHRRETIGGRPDSLRSVVGRNIQPELDELQRLTLSVVSAGLGVWALGLIGGWWLASRAIRPISAISATASRIAEGNLDDRIDTRGTDNELDQLAKVLNQTFERLAATFERQRRFTADASHELRTPVTILLSETQRILRRERSTEEYREALQTCHDSANRMRELTESLLTLSRQEVSDAPHEPLDLAEIVSKTLHQLAPLASEKSIQIETDLQPANCSGDPAALAILASNLLSNAIQHQSANGSVTLATRIEDGQAILQVSDTGPGIAAEDLPHIFDRFYRADKARTGTSGHTGLGLAIAKTIADKHQASLGVSSDPGEGTTFTLALPIVSRSS